MKLVFGLGNPGAQYEKTRHNAGFMVVDALARRHASGGVARSRFHAATLDAMIGGEKCVLGKPTTYMNRSGQSIGEAVRFFKIDPAEDLIVIVDDVALPVGSIRLRKSGGAGGHNGLSDIDRALGGADYPRLRVGIGEVPRLMVQSDWVLSRFMDEERGDIERAIETSCDALEHALEHGHHQRDERVQQEAREARATRAPERPRRGRRAGRPIEEPIEERIEELEPRNPSRRHERRALTTRSTRS